MPHYSINSACTNMKKYQVHASQSSRSRTVFKLPPHPIDLSFYLHARFDLGSRIIRRISRVISSKSKTFFSVDRNPPAIEEKEVGRHPQTVWNDDDVRGGLVALTPKLPLGNG